MDPKGIWTTAVQRGTCNAKVDVGSVHVTVYVLLGNCCPCFFSWNLAATPSSCEHFVLLRVAVEVGLFLHVAICQMRAGWQDVQPDMDLHCVIKVSSFCLCWQMDTLYNVFGGSAHRQTACMQRSAGTSERVLRGRFFFEGKCLSEGISENSNYFL